MGLLGKSSRDGLLTRRSGVFVAVFALHVTALLVAVQARVRADAEPQVVAMQVALLAEVPPPVTQPKLELPAMQVAMPSIDIPVVEVPELLVVTPPPIATPVAPPAIVATPTAEQGDSPVMLAAEEVDYLRPPEPHYPRAAKQARLQGTVLLWVLIDAEGLPREIRVHRSSGYEQLDREGRDAVSRARFKPYRQHGMAHSAQVIIPIEFTLTGRDVSRN